MTLIHLILCTELGFLHKRIILFKKKFWYLAYRLRVANLDRVFRASGLVKCPVQYDKF